RIEIGYKFLRIMILIVYCQGKNVALSSGFHLYNAPDKAPEKF
ncbi:6985_t:CDS:1, partial [Racocetra fulgida]